MLQQARENDTCRMLCDEFPLLLKAFLVRRAFPERRDAWKGLSFLKVEEFESGMRFQGIS